MISEKEYLAAKKIIEEYEEEERVLNEIRRKKREAEQIQKENECAEHYYLPIIPRRWEASMRCQSCGKEIR